MRFPFDLIAALLLLEAVRIEFKRIHGIPPREEIIEIGKMHATTGQVLIVLLAFWLVVWLMHEWLTRKIEWKIRWGKIEIDPSYSRSGRKRPHPVELHTAGTIAIQVLTVLMYGGILLHYRWPLRTCEWPEWIGVDRWFSPEIYGVLHKSAIAGALFDLGPFLIAMLLGWLPKHRLAQRIVRRGLSLKEYLGLEARLTFLPVVLWFVVCLLEDIELFLIIPLTGYKVIHSDPSSPFGIIFLLLFAVVVLPVLVTHFWKCRPFPEGELRDRLEGLQRRSGVRARRILLWGPSQGFANACVLGPWEKLRYILISPGLLDLMEDDECEAVLAHELGHARHGHLTIMLALIVTLVFSSGWIMVFVPVKSALWQAAIFMAIIVVFIRVFFGMISRMCEREADLASAELLGSPIPLVTALEKLGICSGNIREVYSWHHDSIAKRVAWLMGVVKDEAAMRACHARVFRLRWALISVSILLIASSIVVWAMDKWG